MAFETKEHTTEHTAEAGHAASVHESFYQEPVFWVAIAFVIFMSLALRPLCRVIAKGLDSSSKKIAEELAEAKRLRLEAEAVLASYQKKQRESLQEAEAMLASAKADADRIAAKAESDLNTALDKRLKAAMDKIAQTEAKALQDMQGYVADIALNTAKKLLSESIGKDGGETLVKEAAAEVARKLH